MPRPPHRRRLHRHLLIILCYAVAINAMLEGPSDSDTTDTESSSNTNISTICPPARKRKREPYNPYPDVKARAITQAGFTSSHRESPARKKVKRDSGVITRARSGSMSTMDGKRSSRDGGRNVEEWVEAVAKSQVLRSRRVGAPEAVRAGINRTSRHIGLARDGRVEQLDGLKKTVRPTQTSKKGPSEQRVVNQ